MAWHSRAVFDLHEFLQAMVVGPGPAEVQLVGAVQHSVGLSRSRQYPPMKWTRAQGEDPVPGEHVGRKYFDIMVPDVSKILVVEADVQERVLPCDAMYGVGILRVQLPPHLLLHVQP